jgi:uncharacterized repeat protein (TIGR03837 family)
MNRRRQWDIFCKVIDNFGDIGVCWRLGADLAARGERVRLWADDTSALKWMAPDSPPGIEVVQWDAATDETATANRLAALPGDVLLEAFGCEIPAPFLQVWAGQPPQQGSTRCWLNLEYLSAEPYVERCHALPSPVRQGPAAGWTKWFFYPGFTPETGGLLREPGLAQRIAAFESEPVPAWLPGKGFGAGTESDSQKTLRVSLFCYEPPALAEVLAQWSQSGIAGQQVELLVTAGRSAQAVSAALKKSGWPHQPGAEWLHIHQLPWLSQADYDKLLWSCDLNFVRGEDSLVRAIWAGKPLVWQIYPQDDAVHLTKLAAFLGQIDAPPSLKAFHAAWNGTAPDSALQAPGAADLADWRQHAHAARAALLAQEDLTSRLLRFVAKKS